MVKEMALLIISEILISIVLIYITRPFYHYLIIQVTTISLTLTLIIYLGISGTTVISAILAYIIPHPISAALIVDWIKITDKWWDEYEKGWSYFADWGWVSVLEKRRNEKMKLEAENMKLKIEVEVLKTKISVYKEIESLEAITKEYDRRLNDLMRSGQS